MPLMKTCHSLHVALTAIDALWFVYDNSQNVPGNGDCYAV